jgi:hypothetical protein
MGIAISQVRSRLRSVNAADQAAIHWPSAVVGLALAVFVVVAISWMAAPRQLDRPVAVAAVVAPAAPPVPTLVPTPIPPQVTPEPAPVVEKVRVANTLGAGVNFRARAGAQGQLLKTVPEGSVLEIAGADQTADGMVWRNVRDASGANGWMASKFLSPIQP